MFCYVYNMVLYTSMKYLFLAVMFLGAGCTNSAVDTNKTSIPEVTHNEEPSEINDVTFPIATYIQNRTQKLFGEYVEDRFTGYHTGDDVEVKNIEEEIPVFAIADGTVVIIKQVGGYGGLIVIEHMFDNKTVTTLYGHLDINNSTLTQGTFVQKGQQIATLGDHESKETDGERKHLHFALYEGPVDQIIGYESTESGLHFWQNPYDFFLKHGLLPTPDDAVFDASNEPGGNSFPISFLIPAGWGVEYVPQIDSLNLFSLTGTGTARERSQLFIRFFDAEDFLTLNTVTIHSAKSTTIGKEAYTAKTYDIEKKSNAQDFPYQPIWRNERHKVTDFRAKEGFTRYFVVGVNPEADQNLVQSVFDSFFVK